MCSHYEAIREKLRLERRFGVKFPDDWDPTVDIWPAYEAAFIRRPREADMETHDEAVPEREVERGSFGLVPHWVKSDAQAKVSMRKCFNARSETAAKLPSFRDAWKYARHCIIPAEAFYEPDWRTGKAIPTRISAVDGEPLGIAGLWAWWKSPEGGPESHSFTMLTINADDHPIMRNMHKPDDEKRMIVILNPDSYDAWLKASPDESRDFLRQYPAEKLIAEARPTKKKGERNAETAAEPGSDI